MSGVVLPFPGRVSASAVRTEVSPLRLWRCSEPEARGRRLALRCLSNLRLLGVPQWPLAIKGDAAAAIAAAYAVAREPVRCDARIDLAMSALWCAAVLDPAARAAFLALRSRARTPS